MLQLRTKGIIAATALLSLALPGVSHAAELMVPLPYLTIQSAINAAANGDTVSLAPGIYNENISLNGKSLTIKAFNTNFDTIIDGGGSGSVVTFNGNEGSNCVIRDLILRNGRAASGGGIQGNYTLATLRNCTIGGNVATSSGGGIHGFSGSIKNCKIFLNQAANGAGVAEFDGFMDNCDIYQNLASSTGGGFYNCGGTVQFSKIRQNEAATAGGGMNVATGTFIGNIIQGNSVTTGGPSDSPVSWGGGINNLTGFLVVSTIIDNNSNGDGGGIANSPGIIQNCVIANNSARRGGGLANCSGHVDNNTIWGNTAAAVGGGCFNMGIQVANCIVYGNSAAADSQWSGSNVPAYSCVQAWGGSEPDITNQNPLLRNPSGGDFDLLDGSPCIDAGKYINDIYYDYQGQPRPVDGTPIPRGDGSDFDIGADEYNIANYDLAATWESVKTKYKGSVPKLKCQLQGKLYVGCVGSENIDTPFAIQFFLSYDNILDISDVPVSKYLTVKKLKAGKTKKAKCKVKMPLNIPATGLYLIGVADSAGNVPEVNESNNIAVWGPLP